MLKVRLTLSDSFTRSEAITIAIHHRITIFGEPGLSYAERNKVYWSLAELVKTTPE